MAYFVEVLGACIPAFLISRLIFWPAQGWDAYLPKIGLVNLFTLTVAVLLGGMGRADGGAFAPIEALGVAGPAQALVLTYDILRQRPQRTSE